MIVTFRIRRDTAANWVQANPVLALGEPGLETDTRRVKYGDGATAWNDLAYSRGGPVSNVDWSGADLSIENGGTGASSASAARDNLGLGTASTRNTGTSGSTIPVLDGVNAWGQAQTFPRAVIRQPANAVEGDPTTYGLAFFNGTQTRFAFGYTATAAIIQSFASTPLTFNPLGNPIAMPSLPVYAGEAAAASAGLAPGTLYRTATGELRVKL